MSALEGVRLKIERAERVIDELETAIVAYLAEQPYETVHEFNPETAEYVVRGRVTKAPIYLAVIVGDVAHNLRSSLDHLAWQLALLATPTPYERTQFPIALDPGEFNSKTGQKMIGDFSPKHRAMVEALQPYNGPNTPDAFAPPALRDLRFLSNTDKHRLLNTTIATYDTLSEPRGIGLRIVRDVERIRDEEWSLGGPIHDAEIVRMVLEGAGPDPRVNVQGEIPVTVTLDDPAITGQQPRVNVLLRAILKGVREVIAAFETDL